MPAENVAPGGIRASLPIYAMLGATALSQVGNVLTFVAVPWFVLQTTGSAARTGIAAGAVALAAVLASLFGGAVPAAMLGRVLGALIGLAMAAAPLGMVVAGFALEAAGISGVLIGTVILYLITTLFLMLSPALRDVGRRLPHARGEATTAEAGGGTR